MMYRLRGIKDLISFKNEECSCFGAIRQGEEKFLANQKTYNIANSPIHNPAKIMSKEHSFFKKGVKKSLKRHFTPIFHQEKTGRTMDANGSPCELNTHGSMHGQKEFRGLFSQQNKLDNFYQKTSIIPEQHLGPLYTVSKAQVPQSINEQKLNQTSYKILPPFIPTSPRQMILIPVLQSPKVIKINYNSPISQPVIANVKEEPKRSASPVSMKNLNGSLSNGNINSNIDQLHIKQANQQQLRKCQSSKDVGSNFPLNELKEMRLEAQKEIRQESYKIQEKFKLKTMDEVAEIYSEIDSEEQLSDSVESVVLGRLNQYSSTIDQDFSEMSTIQRSTQGKLIRLNSLMTNFDFVRNQHQGSASQFLSY